MDSFPSQPIGRYRAQQSTQRFNARGSGASPANKANAEPEFYGIYTGEYRVPVRDRVQRLRDRKSVPDASRRPDTPIPSKRTTSGLVTPPRTPPMLLPSLPECPGAPPRKRVSRVRRLNQRQSETDEDILLDRKAIERTKRLAPFQGARRQYVNVTPDRNTPLRQSWGPLELAEIDSRLQALLRVGGEEDVEIEKPFQSEVVGKLDLENRA
ncbi:hypothetical protein F5B21DRAFT_504303 [Xylaria acuta]|nr:hypothetical protein F5B21DRAFT_504303 [Xylaria acuta]